MLYLKNIIITTKAAILFKGVSLMSFFMIIAVEKAHCIMPPENPVIKTNWQKNTFQDKVFIENKGQFICHDLSGDEVKNGNLIKYGTILSGGVEIYFTAHGLTYRHVQAQHLSEDEREGKGKMQSEEKSASLKADEERKKISGSIPYYLHMDWVGANSNAQLIAEDVISNYFTYGYSGASTIKASAFRKIIYKNLYPSIDVEYSFPVGKEGIKYTLILHPGADASVIRMRYSDENKSEIDGDGNIAIRTPFGNIVDHAPISFYANSLNGLSISSSFALINNVVFFNLSNYDTSRTIIIDPWTSVPVFSGTTEAYDLDYDYDGNVYVYGGDYPYRLIKYDSTGTVLWTYTTPFSASYNMVGDFTVDKSSGSVYICEGFNNYNPQVEKVNSAGTGVATLTGNSSFDEFWKIKYSECIHKLIIAGGGVYDPNQAAILDTNLSAITIVNVLSAYYSYHDMSLLALDNNGYAYMATNKSCCLIFGLAYDNMLLKLPLSTNLLPLVFMVPDNHHFYEAYSLTYYPYATGYPNGYNGMAVNNNFLYTYDDSLLEKWNKNTGALINSITVSSASFNWIYPSGGLTVDECDNIYVGAFNTIKQYNANLNLVTTINMSDTVYDVKLGTQNYLYACGKGFVSSFTVNNALCNLLTVTITSTTGTCTSPATATVNVTGGTPPYTYLWNPTGQTTQTATGLSAGTYIVTVTDASSPCNGGGNTQTASITITTPPFIINVPSDYYICGETGGSVTLTASGGTSYEWSPGGTLSDSTIANPVASPAFTTTYTVIISDGYCSDTAQVIVHIVTPPPPPTITQQGDTVRAPQGYSYYQWYLNGLLIPSATDSFYVAQTTGTYSVQVTDSLGCSALSNGLYVLITSVKDLGGASSGLEIYPNPWENQLTIANIQLPIASRQMFVSIFNVVGEKVFDQNYELQSKDHELKIDISFLPKGVYFVQVICPGVLSNNDDQVYRVKMVKN